MWLRVLARDKRSLGIIAVGCAVLYAILSFMPRATSPALDCESSLEKQKQTHLSITALVDECDAARDKELRERSAWCLKHSGQEGPNVGGAGEISGAVGETAAGLDECAKRYSKLMLDSKAINDSYAHLSNHVKTREKSCSVVASSLEAAIESRNGAEMKSKTLEEKDRTSQAIIENLRSSLVKSEYHQSKRWKEEQNERPQATKSGVSIYVYDLPRFNTDFYNAHKLEYTKKCRNQIGERELHQRFLDSPNRVLDGELADLYYVPVYTGCYRTVIGTELLTDAYAATYKFITDATDVIKKDFPYWERSQGRDHVWVFLYDYGVCLEYARINAKTRRIPAGLENSIFAQYLGDVTPGMECFNTWKDVVIPPFVNNPEILAGRGGEGIDPTARATFAYFRGSIKWKESKWHTKEMNYSNGVRDIINRTYHNDTLFSLHQGSSPDYIQEMKNSVFCLAPLGYALWNFRLYEAVMLGCIPVIIADNIELPFESVIDYRSFTVKILETQVVHLKQILQSIPKEDIQKKQQTLKRVWKKFAYTSPSQPDDAFGMLLEQLEQHANRPHQPAAKTYWL